MVELYEGASIEIPPGAFPEPNQLQVTRVDVAFDQIAPDVSAGEFYVLITQDDVPALGAPVILEVPKSTEHVTVVRYDGGAWLPVEVEAGPTTRIRIDHFSKGIFGFFEWWSEKDVEMGETLDSMDNDSPQARMRSAIEGGDPLVHSFFGVNEQSDQTDTEMCYAITSMLKLYNLPHNRAFPANEGSTRDLAEFLFDGASPSNTGGQYWDLTKDSMEEIRDKLLENQTQISPAEFLKIAIDANNGNIPLGVLAAHNYLKEITYRGRTEYSPSSGMPPEYGEPASRLRSWRQGTNITAAGEYDKMGPLYHIFAAMTGALWLPTSASGPAIASGEAFLRTFRVGSDRPDTPKAAADQCGIDAAAWLRNHPPEEEGTPTTSSVDALGGFQEADCAVPGVTFPSPYIGDQVTDEVFDGPSLICDSSTEGAHGLPVNAHIGITAYKADKLEGFYQQAVEGIRGFVDQANERNAIPDVPADARFEITFIRNDNDGYVFMITGQANVYDCLLGSGYGEEKIEGKYLVNLGFQSCEGDAAAYTAALESLRTAALAAIERVETARPK